MRIPLAVVALLLATATASAQTSVGLKVGFNVAGISFDDDVENAPEESVIDTSPRLGFAAGVFADIALTPALTFHPEVLYSQKGITRALRAAPTSGGVTQQIDYVEAPILLSLRAPAVLNGLVFGIEAGPTFAYKVRTSIRCTGRYQEVCDSADAQQSAADGFGDYDLGAALGVTVGTGPVHIGARFTQGIMTTDDPESQTEPSGARNHAFSLAAHYTFGG
ncbi:MAG TPA: porin family protein [Rubricoccaceae bacterium]|jgi:hypothetical protein